MQNFLNFAFDPGQPGIPSTSRPNDRLGILRDHYAVQLRLLHLCARTGLLLLVHHRWTTARRGPMEFQMRVRLRVQNCQNEFSSGRGTRPHNSGTATRATRREEMKMRGKSDRRERRKERYIYTHTGCLVTDGITGKGVILYEKISRKRGKKFFHARLYF